MKLNNIGGYKDVNTYVQKKYEAFENSDKRFSSLYDSMFSEAGNTFFERSRGYTIEKITYGECREQLEKRAATLKSMLNDPEKDSVIGLHMDNSVSWIQLFWAILLIGCRPLLMNTRLDDGTLETALKDTNAIAVITDGRKFSIRTIMEEEITEAEAPARKGEFGSELMVMSSGTSSHIKICCYSAEQFCHQIRDSYDIICRNDRIKQHYEGELKLLTFLPFYHVFGLIAVYIWFSFFSRTFVLLNDLSAQTLLSTIRRHKVTHIFAVPLFWEKIHSEVLRTIHDRGEKTEARFKKGLALSEKLLKLPGGEAICKKLFKEVRGSLFGDSVLFTITGGSFINPETLHFFNAMGYYLCNGYGMSEIGITSVELSAKAADRCRPSIGTPMSSVEYRVSPEGMLEVRGPSTARRILQDGQETRRGDEWFQTGDLAALENGKWFLQGRGDDLVIGSAGENLNPNLIEPRLATAGVRELCLIGGHGLVPTLVCAVPPFAADEQVKATEKRVHEQIAAAGLNGQISRVVMTRADLTAENDFKISRARVRDRLIKNELPVWTPGAAKAAESSDDPLTDRVTEMFRISLSRGEVAIGPDDDYFTLLGGSSLDYLVLAEAIQEEFRVSLPSGTEQKLTTVNAVVQTIREGGAC